MRKTTLVFSAVIALLTLVILSLSSEAVQIEVENRELDQKLEEYRNGPDLYGYVCKDIDTGKTVYKKAVIWTEDGEKIEIEEGNLTGEVLECKSYDEQSTEKEVI